MNGDQQVVEEFVQTPREQAVEREHDTHVKEPRDSAQKAMRGTIIPDDIPLKSDQIHESEFLDQLAWKITDSLTEHVPWSESLSRVRYGEYLMVREILQAFRDDVIGKSVSLEAWLRTRLRIPDEQKVTPEEFIDRILGLVDLKLLFDLQQRVSGLSEESIRTRTASEGPEDDELFAQLAAEQGIDLQRAGFFINPLSSICAPGKRPPLPGYVDIPFVDRRAIGILVHLMIQEHYILSHTSRNHHVLAEERMYFPGGGHDTIRNLSQGRTGAAYSLAAVLTDFARTLRKVNLNGTKASWIRLKPDIVNYNTREVYEIKSRGQFQKGLLELYLVYLPLLNRTVDILSDVEPSFDSRHFRPGIFQDWRPFPFYPIPPDLFAITCVDPFAPGLIIYDLYRLRRLPVLEPIPVKVPSGKGITIAQLLLFFLLIVLTILFIVLVVDMIPGDEVLLVPAILKLVERLGFVRLPAFAF